MQSLPIAGLLAVLVGLGFARLITSTQLFVAVPVFTDLILHQIGPLLAALVVVTRSAPAVAVELGNMRVAGEVRMLERFGVDPFRHLAWPVDSIDAVLRPGYRSAVHLGSAAKASRARFSRS